MAQNGIGHRALKYMKIRGNSINILYLEGATNEIKENKKFPCLTLIMMNINNHNYENLDKISLNIYKAYKYSVNAINIERNYLPKLW